MQAKRFGTPRLSVDRAGPIERRIFLQRVGGAVAGGALLSVLSACQSFAPASGTAPPAPSSVSGNTQGASTSASTPSTSSALPAYLPLTGGFQPDVPSTGQYIDDGFVNYPAHPFKAVPGAAPGSGGTVQVFMLSYYPPVTPLEQNPAWQEVNRQLGASVQFNFVAGPDYSAKLGTLMAGNDLPDVIAPSTSHTPAKSAPVPPGPLRRPDPLPRRRRGERLSLPGRHSGTRVEERRTDQWKALHAANPAHDLRPEWHSVLPRPHLGKEIGANVWPSNADDFKRMLVQLNHPQENRYAFGAAVMPFGLVVFAQIFGAPNNWGLDSAGKLVRDRETDAYKGAVSYTRDLLTAGVYSPNQLTTYPNNGQATRQDVIAGRIAVVVDGAGAAWGDVLQRGAHANPPMYLSPIPPFPAQDGGTKVHYFSTGYTALNTLRQASPDRIRELLRVINWLAAPFGSQEDLLLKYGVGDVDYTLDDKGNPVPTDRGLPDAGYMPWQFLSKNAPVQYNANVPAYAQMQRHAEELSAPAGVFDATQGYISDTALNKGPTLEQAFLDGTTDIIAGRRPMSDYDGLVKDWQTNGGDQIRKEYLQQMGA